MRLEMLAKDSGSGNQGCYLGDDLQVYVQADEAPQDAHAPAENLLPGEPIVRIDPQVIRDAADRLSRPAGKHAGPGRSGVLGMVPGVPPLLLSAGDAAVPPGGCTRLGVAHVTDPGAALVACRQREAALRLAQPWDGSVRERPDLAQRVPTVQWRH